MPVLISTAGSGKHTFVWKCSACDAVFSLESIFREPTETELKDVDATFREHCKKEHPGFPVMGLPLAG